MNLNEFMTYQDLIDATRYRCKRKQAEMLASWGYDTSKINKDGYVTITWGQYYKGEVNYDEIKLREPQVIPL